MRFQGTVYRAHDPRWSFTPLSGECAKMHGGRFNPKGVAALYTSLTVSVALAEYQQGFAHRPQPTLLCAYEVDCDEIVDLTQASEQRTYQVTDTDLSCAWEWLIATRQMPPSWVLSTALMQQGMAGIMVPSYATNAPVGGKNLVLWHWSDQLPSQVRLIDDHGLLPNNQDSWK